MSLLQRLLGLIRGEDLLITDVTRMQQDRVCVAGMQGARTVRLDKPQPTRRLLDRIGPLLPGDLVRVNWSPTRRSQPPHTEDSRWSPSSLRKVGNLTADDMIERLEVHAIDKVSSAFGEPMYFGGRGNPAFEPDVGARSLATLRVSGLEVTRLGEGFRASFRDAEAKWSMLPVEDLSLRVHATRCAKCVAGTSCPTVSRLSATDALIRVGLTRPFVPDGQPAGCFMQVNYILPQQAVDEADG